MTKLYILSFDPYKSNATFLHSVITNMPLMKAWWHYIGSAYLITSTSSAAEIQNHINTRWTGNYLLIEVDPKNSGGWLPKAAWDWINSNP
jgi:hypothetical protein